MSWLLTLLSSFWKPIAAGVGGLFIFLFQRWSIKHKNKVIERQDQAIRVHVAKEQIHELDRTLESETDQQLSEINKKVNQADTPEQAAGVVAEELNKYFGTSEKD